MFATAQSFSERKLSQPTKKQKMEENKITALMESVRRSLKRAGEKTTAATPAKKSSTALWLEKRHQWNSSEASVDRGTADTPAEPDDTLADSSVLSFNADEPILAGSPSIVRTSAAPAEKVFEILPFDPQMTRLYDPRFYANNDDGWIFDAEPSQIERVGRITIAAASKGFDDYWGLIPVISHKYVFISYIF